jgi:hypothetical protein
MSLSLLLSACGGKKQPAPVSQLPARITLNPATSYSMQEGAVIQFTASAQNVTNSSINPVFTYASTNPNIVDIAPNGGACAGSWNAPSYTVCTPAGEGTAMITATALGQTSEATLVFVHPPIDNIVVSIMPPVNNPPPACPNQIALPAACEIAFNTSVCQPNQPCACLSANQTETLQATAYSQGTDITASVGPFSWTQANTSVGTITPVVTNNTYNVPTNQATIAANTPGQTQVIASASGAFSQPFNFETCNVQCIALQLGVTGLQQSNQTNFVINKGTTETITATAVDVQGCIVPKPPLTWVSSTPAALTPGSASTGCGAGTTCSVSSSQVGSAAITASCSPPTCNVGFPLNPAGYPAASPYIPKAVFPVTAISGIVTGAAATSNVMATSQDCYSDAFCTVGLYYIPTNQTVPGAATNLPTPPNSLMFDPAGDKAYMGSEFGALAINPASIGTANPFTPLPASGNPTGYVTGKVLAVSPNGNFAVFSDTVSTPNQVYIVNAPVSSANSTFLDIDSAIAAAFSPDGTTVFILGNGGTSLYIYSGYSALQPPISLPTPATSIVFNSSGSFALLSGGATPGNLAAYSTCNSFAASGGGPVYLTAGTIPSQPLFLKMVPGGNVPITPPYVPVINNVPTPLQPIGLDYFIGLDNTGLDIIATNSSQQAPNTSLCPQPLTVAMTAGGVPFPPVHIDLGKGTFHPIAFFLSPDATQVYIVTTDVGVLIYSFNTQSVAAGIELANNATPVAADITVDGTLIYVAGSDGLLHQLNTQLLTDENQISFSPLPNSSNPFCFSGESCALNLVAVKP